MKPDLVLGTASFGLDYGITNKIGKISIEEARSILIEARKYGINRIDTAQAYGDSEQVISMAINDPKNYLISSKLDLRYQNKTKMELYTALEDSLFNSLDNLKLASLDCLLIHRSSDLLNKNSNLLIDWLLETKNKGLIKRIGVSVYNDENIYQLPLEKIDLVQIPISVFDQRSIKSGLVNYLSNREIEVQARSIFLQGLILTPSNKLPNWVSKNDLIKHSSIWDYLVKSKIHPLDYCLDFFKERKDIGSITFGLQTIEQLNEIVQCWNSKTKYSFSNFDISFSDRFLDPRQWPTS